MNTSDSAIAVTAALLACVPLGAILWRRRDAVMREKDLQLRNLQLSRLQSLRELLQDAPARAGYPDLPGMHLAELIAVQSDEESVDL